MYSMNFFHSNLWIVITCFVQPNGEPSRIEEMLCSKTVSLSFLVRQQPTQFWLDDVLSHCSFNSTGNFGQENSVLSEASNFVCLKLYLSDKNEAQGYILVKFQ